MASGLLFCVFFVYLPGALGGGVHNPSGVGEGGLRGVIATHSWRSTTITWWWLCLASDLFVNFQFFLGGGGVSYIMLSNFGANIYVLFYARWSDPQTQLE